MVRGLVTSREAERERNSLGDAEQQTENHLVRWESSEKNRVCDAGTCDSLESQLIAEVGASVWARN